MIMNKYEWAEGKENNLERDFRIRGELINFA